MSDRVDVVPLADEQITRAAEACARAFHDVNLMRAILPDVDERTRLAPLMFDQGIRYATLVGKVFVPAGEPVGLLYGWRVPPPEPSIERMIETGLQPLHVIIGEETVHRFERLVNPIEEHQARLVPPPFWYLGLLGVDPARQGAGIGSALVRAFLQCAADDARPTCLWTTTESNVGFYKRLGFEVVAAAVVAESDLPYWIFRQDP